MAAFEPNNLELPHIPKVSRRGRPSTGQALSNAERQRLHRNRLAVARTSELKASASVWASTSDDDLAQFMRPSHYDGDRNSEEMRKSAWAEMGRRHGWLK
jgi:hypothetical protein